MTPRIAVVFPIAFVASGCGSILGSPLSGEPGAAVDASPIPARDAGAHRAEDATRSAEGSGIADAPGALPQDVIERDAGEPDAVRNCTSGLVTLVVNASLPGWVNIDSTDVFFLGGNDPDNAWKVSKCGGTAVALTTGGHTNAEGGRGLGVNAAGVYWEDFDGDIVTAPLSGGVRTTLVRGKIGEVPMVMSADAANVYWGTSTGRVAQVPAAGGKTLTLVDKPLSSGESVSAIASDATYVYFASYPVGLCRVPIGGGAVATLLMTGFSGIDSLAVDATNAYWTSGLSIVKLALAGGTPTTLVAGTDAGNEVFGTSIAVDGDSVYWTTQNNNMNPPLGNVMKVPIAGGPAVTLER